MLLLYPIIIMFYIDISNNLGYMHAIKSFFIFNCYVFLYHFLIEFGTEHEQTYKYPFGKFISSEI